jgi:allantoinase
VTEARPPVAGQLDHTLYEPRVSWRVAGRHWPGGHAAAACVLIHLEAFEIEAPEQAWRDPGVRGDFGSYFPDYRAHSLLEYGTRIGVFRLLDLLQALGWSVCVAVNGCIAQQRPALLRELQGRGVELLASGWSASRMHTSALAETQERAWLAQSADALAQATGVRAAGYASQDYGYSTRSAGLLEELGFHHVVDWPNDEIPFAFGPARKLVALPPAADLDDAQAVLARKLLARRWAQTVQASLAHWVSHAPAGAVFVLPLHAWVAGAAHRAPALRRALASVDAGAFWQAPPSAITQHWRVAHDTDSKPAQGAAA